MNLTRRLTCQKCQNPWDAPNRGPAAKMCPSCSDEARRARCRTYHRENRDRSLARQAEWRAANTDRRREYDAAYRVSNRDAILAQKKDYYLRNSDALSAAAAAYKKENPEKYREYVRRRKAMLTAAFVAPVDDMEIYERDGGICQLCHESVDKTLRYPDPMCLTIDHVIPLVAGGTHEPDNAQLAHMRCNSRKRDSIPS